jgi:hypothetical protein
MAVRCIQNRSNPRDRFCHANFSFTQTFLSRKRFFRRRTWSQAAQSAVGLPLGSGGHCLHSNCASVWPSSWLLQHPNHDKTVSFLSFPYVCPEPVLVKR